MPLGETIVIHSENHTNNKQELCGKLWIFLTLEEVMCDFKFGCNLLIGVLCFLCSELYMLLVANSPKDSQIPLPIGLLL